jgi:hypothetical protein
MNDMKPYPEAIEKRRCKKPYKIHIIPQGGMVSKVKREMFVPLDDGVIRHEMAHVKWSPRKTPDADDRTATIIQAVEDARINTGMHNLGLPVNISESTLTQGLILTEMDYMRDNQFNALLRILSTIKTNVLPKLIKAFQYRYTTQDEGFLELVLKLIKITEERLKSDRPEGKSVAPFETTLEIVKIVEEELSGKYDYKDIRGFPSDLGVGSFISGRPYGVLTEDDGGPSDRMAGAMTIRTAPLTVVLKSILKNKASHFVSAPEGSVIRDISRWCSDKSIFRCAKKRGKDGATVLVDTSGSMRIDPHQIDEMATQSPWATTVAIYSANLKEGELRIIAKEGRMASWKHMKRFDNSNVVDAPALKWLSKQPKPRLWVSDGIVTGVGDRSYNSIKKYCSNICDEYDIVRLDGPSDAVKYLEEYY